MSSIQYNKDISSLNSFKISVQAKTFATFEDTEQVKSILSQKEPTTPLLILGGGSNILFTHDVFDGLVLKNEIKGIEKVGEDNNFVYIKAGGGETWHQFVLYCVNNNYQGVENLSLIPGTVGAAPMQNIGAYGVEIKDVFYSLEALQINNLSLKTFSNTECAFGYRESVFKNIYKNQFIILNVTFRLNKHPKLNTSYGAIEKQLEAMNVTNPSIKNISDAVIAIRQSKLPNPQITGNAGSFFKNPTITTEHYAKLYEKYSNIAAYKNEHGYKIAAGWLIEQCGFKGLQKQTVGCHHAQALVIVNLGNATGKEVYNFSEEIIEAVHHKFDIKLEREVNII